MGEWCSLAQLVWGRLLLTSWFNIPVQGTIILCHFRGDDYLKDKQGSIQVTYRVRGTLPYWSFSFLLVNKGEDLVTLWLHQLEAVRLRLKGEEGCGLR